MIASAVVSQPATGRRVGRWVGNAAYSSADDRASERASDAVRGDLKASFSRRGFLRFCSGSISLSLCARGTGTNGSFFLFLIFASILLAPPPRGYLDLPPVGQVILAFWEAFLFKILEKTESTSKAGISGRL